MSMSVTVAGSTVNVLGSVQVQDSVGQRSTATFVVRDPTGTAIYSFGQPVVISDSTNGTLFTGYVNQADETKLIPNVDKSIAIQCMDLHYLADKRRVTYDYTSMAAGDIATDLLSNYLSAEGITAGYAYKHVTTNTDWSTGATLTNASATSNVGDGDLELSKAGSDTSKTFATTSDWTTGATLTSIDAGATGQTANQINLQAYSAIKFTGHNIGNVGNSYAYWEIGGATAITINSGDNITYDVWISSTSPAIQAAVDCTFTDGTTMRDFGGQSLKDQNNIHAHPGSDLTGFANDQWYHRFIDLTAVAGKSIAYVTVVFEGDTGGDYTAYFRNIRHNTNLGASRHTYFDSTANTYTPASQSLGPNYVVSANGYSNLHVSSVTVYDQTGTWQSPAISIDTAKIVKSSLVSWQSVVPSGITPATTTGSNSPAIPTGTTLTVYTSIDDTGTWQPCTFKAAIPNLAAGFKCASRNMYIRAVLAIANPSPEVSPIVNNIQTTVTSSWTQTKTDVLTIYKSSGDFNAGNYTGTQYFTANNLSTYFNTADSGVSLTGYWDGFDALSGGLTYTALWGTGSPSAYTDHRQLVMLSGTATDSRLEIPTGNFQDFTAQVSFNFADASRENGCGIVYRTTAWQNNNNTFAYTAMMVCNTGADGTPNTGNATIQLGRGTNSSVGAGAYTGISTVNLPFTPANGNTYTLKVVVSGSNHKVYLDDVLWINATDATYAATGQVAIRYYNNTGGVQIGTLDNFGIESSTASPMSGTWDNGAGISLGSTIGTAGNSIVAWDDDIPGSATVLVETSINGGSTWQTATNGGAIPNLGPGTSTTGKSVKVRVTLTSNYPSVTPIFKGLYVWITTQTNASGTRVGPALSLANVGRAGSTLLSVNSLLPTNTSLGLDISTNGSTWTDLTDTATTAYSAALPTSVIYTQPDPFVDFFQGSSSTAGNGVTIGINPGTGNPGSPYAFWTQLFADMQALGMTWLRFQLSWDSIELTQGSYSWTVLDDAVSHCNAAGVKIWYTIRGAPSWALDPANGGQLTCSDGWYIMSPTKAAAFATVLMQRYYPGSPHGNLDGLGFNEDFNIRNTSTSDTLTLNQTITNAGGPYTSLTINAAGFTPMVGTVVYFGSYGSADHTTITTNVNNGDTTIHVASFTPAVTYNAGTSIKLAYVPATSSVYDLYDPGSGGRTTANPKSQASRNPVYAAAVFNAVAPAIRALNTNILIGMPCTWWLQPINAPTFPGSTVSNMTAFVTYLLVHCAANIDANTFMDGHFYTNAVDPTVGNGQTSTIAQWVADFQNAANANGFPNLALVCSEFGWQANQNATSSTSVAGAGSHTITLDVTRGAANGITCLVDTVGSGVQETVTITAKTSTSITAVFANAHTQPFPVVIQLDCAATGADGQDERYNEVLTAIAPGGARGNKAFIFTIDETQSLSAGSGSSVTLWNGTGYTPQPSYSTIQTFNTALNGDFASYTQTNLSGGAATWTWDTTNKRLLGTQTTNVRGILEYTTFSRKDMYAEVATNYSDSGGPVVRMVDTNNAYYLVIRDSGSSATPNTVQIKAIVAGVVSNVSTLNNITFNRGEFHVFRLDIQGTTLNAYMDNVLVATGTDTNISSAGSPGMMCAVLNGKSVQYYYFRAQPYGDTVTSTSLYTRQRLASTDPTVTPQCLDLTLSVHDPNIGNGATIGATAYATTGQNMYQVSQALDDIAKQSITPSQFTWYFEKSTKKLHFHQQQAIAAPFYVYSDLSGLNNGKSGNIQASTMPTVTRPDMLYRNRQTVDGGTDVTSTINYTVPTDGFTQSWPMQYALNAAPTITLDGNVQTVGIQGIDSGKNFYYQIGSNLITQDTSASPPSKTDTLIVSYVGQFQVRVTRNNVNGTGTYAGTVGQTQLAAIDKSSGIVEDYVSVPGLNKAQAQAYADALLVQYGQLGILWDFTTLQFGIQPGMLIGASVAEYGIINLPMLVTKVTTTAQYATISGGVLYYYNVSATSGAILKDFEIMLPALMTAK